MKTTEFRKLIREEVRKVLSEANITGDYNNASFIKSSSYLKTPEGMKAVKLLKSLVNNNFNASDLRSAIRSCKFKKMKDFQAAAKAGGLEISGLGNLTTDSGDFEVMNDTYTDTGAAISFFRDKFENVG